MAPTSTTWQDRIKEVLEDGEHNQVAIAAACGISRQAVSQWVNGKSTDPRPIHVFAIADLTGYSARWLATGKGPRKGKDEDVEALSLWRSYCSRPEAIREAIKHLLTMPVGNKNIRSSD